MRSERILKMSCLDPATKEIHENTTYELCNKNKYNVIFVRMLIKFIFNDKWRSQIRTCMLAGNMVVLVNDSPTHEIKIQRRIERRRPLTPFLFLLVVEDLNGLMKRAIELNFYSGFKVRSSNLETTHIQYADDTLILGDPLVGNLWAIKAVLRAFGLALGLAVNFHKTSLIEINVHISFLALVENFLHIKIVSLPFK